MIDASVVVDVLVNGQRRLPGAALAAPAHIDAEVLSALGRLHRQRVLLADEVDEMLEDLAALAVQRVPIVGLTTQAFALRHNVALRDGLYVALAQGLDAALFTADAKLADACRDHGLCALLA